MIKGIDELRTIRVGLDHFSKKMLSVAKYQGIKEMEDLRGAFILRTPVDEGTARASWSELRMDATDIFFTLNVPYGYALDEGSIPGHRPWPNPGPKTELYKGRVYSSQVADGEGGMSKELLKESKKQEIMGSIVAAVMEELANDLD